MDTLGSALGMAARDGTLGRGPRDILTHHVIFRWHRACRDVRVGAGRLDKPAKLRRGFYTSLVSRRAPG